MGEGHFEARCSGKLDRLPPGIYIAVVEAHHRCILLSAPEISVAEKALGRIL